MKPFLIQQLERYALRLTELDFLLSREDIMADMTQFLKLSREHAEVSAVASRFARFQQRTADLSVAQAMLDDEDLREMAEEEVASASAELQTLEAELQRMLLPKDPDDARPAFVEIRAGTGGDERHRTVHDLLARLGLDDGRGCRRGGAGDGERDRDQRGRAGAVDDRAFALQQVRDCGL